MPFLMIARSDRNNKGSREAQTKTADQIPVSLDERRYLFGEGI